MVGVLRGVGVALPRGVAAGELVRLVEALTTVRSAVAFAGAASLMLGVEPEAVRFLPAVGVGEGLVIGPEVELMGVH
jgi:hypothetical protein